MSTETYSPRWALHVSGTYERAMDPVTGKPEPTIVRLACATCGDTHQARCESGAPRQWVLIYARAHVHRDVLKTEKKK